LQTLDSQEKDRKCPFQKILNYFLATWHPSQGSHMVSHPVSAWLPRVKLHTSLTKPSVLVFSLGFSQALPSIRPHT
jgi:hypothetical protein